MIMIIYDYIILFSVKLTLYRIKGLYNEQINKQRNILYINWVRLQGSVNKSLH